MEEITQSYLKEIFDYHSDGHLIRKRNNKIVESKLTKHHRYARVLIGKKTYKMHRIIFLMHHGYLPKVIDHIDGNNVNNKIENLREATYSQNSLNKKHYITSSAPYKGLNTRLWKDGINKSYEVYVTVNKKSKFFGRFRDPEEANKVAMQIREKYHGEFANHGVHQGAIN